VQSLLAGHGAVGGAFEGTGMQVQGIGVLGASTALSDAAHTYQAGAHFSFGDGFVGHGFMLGLLDLDAGGAAGPLGLRFSVSNGGTTLLDQSFTSLDSAEQFFTDHPIWLGDISGGPGLSLDFWLTGDQARYAEIRYVLGGMSVSPVPELPPLPLMLMGGSVLWWVRRRGAMTDPRSVTPSTTGDANG
jgi:hypothetical protein